MVQDGLVLTIAVLTFPLYERIIERLTGIAEAVVTNSKFHEGRRIITECTGTPALHDVHHVEDVPHLLRVVTLLEFEERLAVIVGRSMELVVVFTGEEGILVRVDHMVEHRSSLTVLTLEEVSLTQQGLGKLLRDTDACLSIVGVGL